jgi:(p)ppGpp synthase/HD superfamily hydrolase
MPDTEKRRRKIMPKFTDTPILGDRYLTALNFVFQAHKHQIRKGNTEVPYFTHLMSVSSLVLEGGGTEEEAIAGLLHDCIEDVGVNPADIETKFGLTVKNIVLELTELDKKLPKSVRKAFYADSVLSMSESAVRVSIADKLHNIRCYALSPELWGKEQHDFYAQLLPNYYERNIVGVENMLVEMALLFEQLS